MMESLSELLRENRESVHLLLRSYLRAQRQFMLRSELLDGFAALRHTADGAALEQASIVRFIESVQEAVLDAPWVLLALRPSLARWSYVRFHVDSMSHEEVSASDFLAFKERLVERRGNASSWVLEVDVAPFNRDFPRMQESRSIGRGLEFLNRKLSSQLFEGVGDGEQMLLEFLRVHQHQGTQLMINERLTDVPALRSALRLTEEHLATRAGDTPWSEVSSGYAKPSACSPNYWKRPIPWCSSGSWRGCP
jgi:sucrose synthase